MKLRKRRRANLNRKGTLLMIATLLVASAALRLALHADVVLAESAAPEDMQNSAEATSQTPAPMTDARMAGLLETLNAREAAVEKREAELAFQAKTIEVAKREVQSQLTKLESAEEKLRSTMALADSAAENDLTQLTALYENMKPKDSAALFEEMDPVFAAGFLGRMRADAAASIMAGLTPQTAYSISVIMAGRNANAPTE